MANRKMVHQGRGVQKRSLNAIGGGCYEVLEVGTLGRVISRAIVRGYEQALIAFSFAAGEVVPNRKNK